VDELIKLLPNLGAGGVTVAVAYFVCKFVLPDLLAAAKARIANNNAATKMFSVMQAEIDGYRRRENDFRAMLDDLPTIKAQLTLANERIEQANKKIAEQSELIKRQSQQIRALTDEIHILKGLK
jgi:uncharacterized coiled-coil protein SlyX